MQLPGCNFHCPNLVKCIVYERECQFILLYIYRGAACGNPSRRGQQASKGTPVERRLQHHDLDSLEPVLPAKDADRQMNGRGMGCHLKCGKQTQALQRRSPGCKRQLSTKQNGPSKRGWQPQTQLPWSPGHLPAAILFGVEVAVGGLRGVAGRRAPCIGPLLEDGPVVLLEWLADGVADVSQECRCRAKAWL